MWSILQAKNILDVAIRARGFSDQELKLLSFNKSASYLLQDDAVVVRISRPGTEKEGVFNGLKLAAWLDEIEFPALRPLRGIPLEPLDIFGASVTFWNYEEVKAVAADPFLSGRLLRDFHEAVDGYNGPFQEWRPLRDAARHIRAIEERGMLPSEDIEFLWRWQLYLENRMKDLNTVLGEGLIHGNSHPRSFLLTGRGFLLADFDFFARAPREWDLVPWGIGPRRYGKSRETFYDFQKGYGEDITAWNGLADAFFAREFLVTTFRLYCDVGHNLSLEGQKRLAYWKRKDMSVWV
jgi:hypothetical protein